MSTQTRTAASYAPQQDVLSTPDAGPPSRPDGDPAEAEAMLATMADEAIDRLLAGDRAEDEPAVPPPAAEDSGPLLSDAERAALAAPAEAEAEAEAAPQEPAPKTPAWARPLVWADRPFGRVPGPAREAAGKIALVTLLNAAAVFAYLLLTR